MSKTGMTAEGQGTPPPRAEDAAEARTAPPMNAEGADGPRRTVRIKLHKDRRTVGKGLYVNVNHHSYFIPRGEIVEVPAYIAEVIENSARQDEQTARMIESLSGGANF